MARDTFNETQHPRRWLLLASLAFAVLVLFVLVALGVLFPLSFERALSAPQAIREPAMLIANLQDFVDLLRAWIASR